MWFKMVDFRSNFGVPVIMEAIVRGSSDKDTVM